MAYTQGIRKTDAVLTNQQPPSYTETIHELMPSTKAKLAALITNMNREEADSDEIRAYERGMLDRNLTVVSDNGSTALVVGAGEAYKVTEGSVIRSLDTGRIFRVTADTTDGATLVSPQRTIDGLSTFTCTPGEKLWILTYAAEEAEPFPTALDRDPSEVVNYLQEFETSYGVSNKMKAKHDRTGNPLTNAEREAFARYAVDKEQAFLFGKAISSGKIKMTGGITNFISTNVFSCEDGALTMPFWNAFLDASMQYKSDFKSDKVLLCGNGLIRSVLDMQMDYGHMNFEAGQERYGIRFNKIITPNGDLNVLVHPLFNDNPLWKYYGIVVDLANITYKYLPGNDDERYQIALDNVGSIDGRSGKLEKYAFHSICGLDVRHEKTHAIITNVTKYAGK